MKPTGVFLVLLVKFCFFDGLSGKSDTDFNPETHKNFKLLPDKDKCGIAKQETNRTYGIFGGYKTKLGEVPWAVTFGEYTKYPDPKDPFDIICGGSLISDLYVLTAGHCVLSWKSDPTFLRFVRIGDWNITGDPDCQDGICAPPVQTINVVKIILHENYKVLRGMRTARRRDIDENANDIALLRLEKAPILSAFVQPVCLPYGPAMSIDFANEETFNSGWGVTEDETLPNILLAVNQKALSNSDCKKAYNPTPLIKIDPGMICVGGVEGKGPCNGDSGSPLTWKGSFAADISNRTYQLGLVSFGLEFCALAGIPVVYTRTTFYMKWILDHMEA